MAPKAIIVTGATGKQGGAVIKALLAHPPPYDFKIYALTRNTSSESAKALLSDPRVELLSGDLKDSPDIFKKAGGPDSIHGAFLVTLPALGKKDAEEIEAKQGIDFVDAAVANNVKHIVFTSVDRGGPNRSDNNPTNIPHFISKHRIEKHIEEKAKDTPLTWTILRTVAFMENLTPNFFGKVFGSWWASVGDKKLQLIATKDIGIFAAQAFGGSELDDYKNNAISLAGDELTQAEGDEIFWKVFGRSMPRSYEFVGRSITWMIPEMGTMFQWFRDEGCKSDIQQCKKLNKNQMNFESWLRTESTFKR